MAETFNISIVFGAVDRLTMVTRRIGQALNGMRRPVMALGRSFARLGRTIQNASEKMKEVGRSMTMRLTTPIVAFGALAIRTAMQFQESMNMVGAVTRTTGTPALQQMTAQARQLGATTQFSATQAAEAMQFLGMSGMNANEIMAAMPSTLNLAASAQMDLGRAADIVTNTMRGFNLQSNQLSNASDILVRTFTTSNTSLEQLGEAMKYVAPVASNLGISLRDTSAAIGLLGNAGIQASMAGTNLRQGLLQLVNPTARAKKIIQQLGLQLTDSQGNIRSMGEIIGEFRRTGINIRQMTQLVGVRQAGAFMILAQQGREAFERYSESLDSAGAAAEVAQAQMRGLPGAIKLLKSAFEAVQLAIVDSGFGDFVETLIRGIAEFLQSLADANPMILKVITIIAGLVAVIGPLIAGIAALNAAFMFLAANPIVLIIAGVVLGIMALIAAIIYLRKNWDKIIKAISDNDVFKFVIKWLKLLIAPILFIATFIPRLIIRHWSRIKGFFMSIFRGVRDFAVSAFESIKEVTMTVFEFLKRAFVDNNPLVDMIRVIIPIVQRYVEIMKTVINYTLRGIKTVGRFISSFFGDTFRRNARELGLTGSSTSGTTNTNRSEVAIRVEAEPGTTATVDRARRVSGNPLLDIATQGFIGVTTE